jgi:hypothetical protein
MSNYTKDRNIITISLDGVNGNYTLDLNTGVYCGVKGTPIKTVPNKRQVRDLFCGGWNDEAPNPNLRRVLVLMLDGTRYTNQFSTYAKALQSAEKLDAIGLSVSRYLYEDQFVYLADNIKYINAWLRDNEADNFDYNRFALWCEFEKIKNSLGSLAETLTAEMYYALRNERHDLTIEELGVCAYYLGRGKMWEYHNGYVHNLIEYIEWCRIMEQKPQRVNNFMREYCETKKTYELRRKEFDDRKMALNYAKYSKAWEFEFGDFAVSIPTCGQDIVDEGRNMHHCVGSYVDRVVSGNTYICFVRRKDTPNECYITCQVNTNGNIGQYFLAYDRYITKEEDIAFKTAFQNHLREVCG